MKAKDRVLILGSIFIGTVFLIFSPESFSQNAEVPPTIVSGQLTTTADVSADEAAFEEFKEIIKVDRQVLKDVQISGNQAGVKAAREKLRSDIRKRNAVEIRLKKAQGPSSPAGNGRPRGLMNKKFMKK